MKKILLFLFLAYTTSSLFANDSKSNVFNVQQPDFVTSPLTGVIRTHWVDAAEYLLQGAFSYIHSLDDAMKFPKQFEKTYPHREQEVPTEKLEGFCRTLFVAAPLLREKPDLELNGINVLDYYRHNLLNLVNPEHPSFIQPRGDGGPNQILVEFGALAISLSIIPDLLWEPLTDSQKEAIASVMISYGDGPTVSSNWRFFNIFVLSFFKKQGYEINEPLMQKYLQECLDAYRGSGWYNDSPAYDYYSMWAFQMYGPVWSELYGKEFYPEYAEQFMSNLADMVPNYPYMFNREGQMNMWGRSMPYRFGAVVPLVLTGFLDGSTQVNYGWMRRIASSTLLQFLQHPDFLEDSVPSLGFYGKFEPAVQNYSCRGSAFWMGKAFMALLLPQDNPFWSAQENNGPWEEELQKGQSYSKFQPGSNLLITDYPNSGAAEMRSWCHERVADDWQKFRSSENYNKLAYNTEFPWMTDGDNGEISMNYGVKNSDNKWEVLRLYTFKGYEDNIYYRDAVLETNDSIRFQLVDIILPDGILRIDRAYTPAKTDILLGHYSLPLLDQPISYNTVKTKNGNAWIISNGAYQLAMIPLLGWSETDFHHATGLHPVGEECAFIQSRDNIAGDKVYATLQLWKKGNVPFTEAELSPINDISVLNDGTKIEVQFRDNTTKTIDYTKY